MRDVGGLRQTVRADAALVRAERGTEIEQLTPTNQTAARSCERAAVRVS